MSSHSWSKSRRFGMPLGRLAFEPLEQRVLLAGGPEIDVAYGMQALPVGSNVDFGVVVAGQASPTRRFTVYNRGDQTLTLGRLNVPDGFRVRDKPPPTIGAYGRGTFSIEMTTAASGAKTGDIWFSTNDADQNHYLFASHGDVVDAVHGGPDLDVVLLSREMATVRQGATIDMGTVPQSAVSPSQIIRVYNRGDQPLHLGTPEVTGGFRMLGHLLPTLAPGKFDDFVVAMETDAAGGQSGAVAFTSDAAGEGEFVFTVQGQVSSGETRTMVAAAATSSATAQRAVISTTQLISSNPGWTWRTPTPPAQNVGMIDFLNAQEGWMAAQGKGLLHTTDGGRTWTGVQFGPPLGFNAVAFTDWQHGWAVGKDSNSWDYTMFDIIWSTSDGGMTWKQQFHAAGSGLGRVCFVDNLTGWALSQDRVLATTNGGQTWAPISLPNELAGSALTDIKFLDGAEGWILGNRKVTENEQKFEQATVAYTADGGKTWSTSNTTSPVDVVMRTISVLDAANVWVAGTFGRIWQYDLSSNSWTEQPNPCYNQVYGTIVGLQFVNGIEGWAASQAGVVMHTIDGGRTWTTNALIPRWSLSGLVFTDVSNGWLMGPFGALYRTTDGGLSWQSLRQGSAAALTSVSFPNAAQGWAAGGEGTILSTQDAGWTWTQQLTPVSVNLNGIHFVDSLRGWAVGDRGKILSTQDGGKHWTLQTSKSSANFSSVYFVNSQLGWAVARDGTILNTKDGGATWTPQNSNGQWHLNKVEFYDAQHGWATASAQKAWPVVLRTDDGGAHWTPVELQLYVPPSPDDVPEIALINSVHFISPTVGWICGGYSLGLDAVGMILQTVDGGKTWKTQEFSEGNSTDQAFNAIWFVDKKNGFAVGEHGQYYSTSDGGVNWKMQVRPSPGVDLMDIAFVGPKLGFAVGQGGAILRTTTGGL